MTKHLPNHPQSFLAASALFFVLAYLCLLFLAGCATLTAKRNSKASLLSRIVNTATPETVGISLVMPNAISGPLLVEKGQAQNAKDRFGVFGIQLQATYRLKPIRIDRQDGPPQPVVVEPAPKSAMPASTANPTAAQ